jgi:hypothetical protein
MRMSTSLALRGFIVPTFGMALAGCGDINQSDQRVEDGKTRTEASDRRPPAPRP